MSFSFDASQFDPSTAIEAWPGGKQPALITDYAIKGTKANDGSGYLMLTLKHGETGKPAFWVLNLWNNSAQAKDIAERELAAIVHVTLGVHQGRLAFQDPRELFNIPFYVLNVPDKDGRNDFKGVYDVNGNEPKKGQIGGGQPAQGQPAFGGNAQPSGVPAQGAQPGPFGGGAAAPAGQFPNQSQGQPATGSPSSPGQFGTMQQQPAQGGFPAQGGAPAFGGQPQQPAQGNQPGQWAPPGGGQPAQGGAPWGQQG